MSDFFGKARTNYFRVKDIEKFKKFLGLFPGIGIFAADDKSVSINAKDYQDGLFPTQISFDHEEQDQHKLFQELVDSKAYALEQEDKDDPNQEYSIDFSAAVAGYLEEGTVALFKSVGSEGLRYLHGSAVAVIHTGEYVQVSLEDIYTLAKKKFPQQDMDAF